MNIIVCDDELIYRKSLHKAIEDWIKKHSLQGTAVIRDYFSTVNILSAWKNGLTIDIAFLDIQMPGEINGLELAKHIRQFNEYASIVFITNYAEYACDGYSVNALRYIQKPIQDSRIYECLDIAYRQWSYHQKDSLCVSFNKQKVILSCQHILYIESSRHRIQIHRVGQEDVEVRSYIKDLLPLLPDTMFVQCHRSYIVNIQYARTLSKSNISLVGNINIPIGEKYSSLVMDCFRQYYQGVTL